MVSETNLCTFNVYKNETAVLPANSPSITSSTVLSVPTATTLHNMEDSPAFPDAPSLSDYPFLPDLTDPQSVTGYQSLTMLHLYYLFQNVHLILYLRVL